MGANMSSPQLEPQPTPGDERSGKRLEEVRKELTKLLALALPGLVVSLFVDVLKRKFETQPGLAVYVLVPLAAVAVIGWLVLKGRRHFQLHGAYLFFLSVYVLTFSVAAMTGVLDWKRSLVGYGDQLPPNTLALNWAGDWRYRFIKKKPARPDMTVVLMKHADTDLAGRVDMANMIKMAAGNGAKAIAFDYYLPDDTDPAVDSLLCGAIEAAREKLPVLVGYNLKNIDGNLRRATVAANLQACLPFAEAQGHLVGYADWDGTVRQMPLYCLGQQSPGNEALSLKLATAASGQVTPPRDGLVQFVEPAEEIKPVRYEELLKDQEKQVLLRDQILLVGEFSDQDIHPTPFGKKPGLIIHALTTDSLRQNRYIERTPAWCDPLIIVVLCYLITVFASQKAPLRRLLYANLIFTAILIAIAAMAMFLWLLWIEIIYPLAAIWLLLPSILILRKLATCASAPASPAP